MKKSRTTMKVPVRSTGSAAHLLVSTGKARPPARTANVDELDCVVMPATVTAGVRTVDYPVGNAITSSVITAEICGDCGRSTSSPIAPVAADTHVGEQGAGETGGSALRARRRQLGRLRQPGANLLEVSLDDGSIRLLNPLGELLEVSRPASRSSFSDVTACSRSESETRSSTAGIVPEPLR
jgi:hypothetical protein